MQAAIVLGLGYGDEGKGITTDYLTTQFEDPIVVRFSGGHQAGHNVVIDGKSHIHSSFGSGTLRGVQSYFTEHCVVYPASMLTEYDTLLSKGVNPMLTLHPRTKITTPYDLAYNRLVEREANHGSVGLGVGATMHRHNKLNHKLHAIDFNNRWVFYKKLDLIGDYYKRMVNDNFSSEDIQYFNQLVRGEIEQYILATNTIMFGVSDYEGLRNRNLVFEGSQGILLDMDYGFFPHVTYAHTTSRNAMDLIDYLDADYPEIFYVTRCYQTRHGNGPMTREGDVTLSHTEGETNDESEWQGKFRTGELDYSMINYAIDIDKMYSSNCGRSLVVTCMDQRPGYRFDSLMLRHSTNSIYMTDSPDTSSFRPIEANRVIT